MRKLKLISLLLTLITVMSCFAGFPAFATEPDAWTASDMAGTDGESYALNQSNFQDWYEFHLDLGTTEIKGTYVLTEDVTVNMGNAEEWASGLPATVWEKPVCKNFKGIFDGNGKTISGVCVVAEDATTKVGLFNMVSGEVKNLRLVNSYFESAANKNAAIEDPANTNSDFQPILNTHDAAWSEYRQKNNIPADKYVPSKTSDENYEGFWNYWSEYVNNTARIPAHDQYENAKYVETGSIAARLTGKIENVYSSAVINNKNKEAASNNSSEGTTDLTTGGIVGMMSTNGYVSKCVFAGNIMNSLGSTGGIVGTIATYARGLRIDNCLNIGKVLSMHDRTGAILGWDKSLSCTVDHCMNLSCALGEGKALGQGSVSEMYGSGGNAFLKFTNFVVVKGIRTKQRCICSGQTSVPSSTWSVKEIVLTELLDANIVTNEGKLPGWSYKEGCVPNPTTHTDIGIGEVLTPYTFNLSTDTTSIRVSKNNAGLRFETTIGNSDLIPFLNAAGATYEMKTIITAADYIEGATDVEGMKTSNFTTAGLDKMLKPYLVTSASKNIRVMAKDGRNAFAGSVVNIKDKNMKFIGIGCLSITIGGKTYDIYANCDVANVVTSVSDAAEFELDDITTTAQGDYKNAVTNIKGETVYSPYTAEQYDIIKTLVSAE